jgi:hypothetical protein
MNTTILGENIKGRGYLTGLRVDGKILKQILQK